MKNISLMLLFLLATTAYAEEMRGSDGLCWKIAQDSRFDAGVKQATSQPKESTESQEEKK